MQNGRPTKSRVSVALFFVWLCLLSTGIACAESATPKFAAIAESGERKPVVVCFGDSVTGVYYHTGGRRAYTDMVQVALEQAYPGTAFEAINAGISGHTTADALARIERDVLAHKPDLVTVMFGLNDMTRVPLEAFEANLKSIIDQCRSIGAEVLLCTPNSVRETEGRPIAKLEAYVAAIRSVAASEDTPLADCYRAFEAIRDRDALEWEFMMSDAIHPNMDGHKRIAEVIASALTGSPASLADADPLPLSIPHTIGRLRDGQPIHVVAMPPYDAVVPSVLRSRWPDARINVTTWPVEGQTLSDIVVYSKQVRELKPDLVFVALPIDAAAETTELFIQAYGAILNYAMSFGVSQWDCVAVPPSFLNPDVADEQIDRDMKRLIRGQDLAAIERTESDPEDVEGVLERWLSEQFALYEDKR